MSSVREHGSKQILAEKSLKEDVHASKSFLEYSSFVFPDFRALSKLHIETIPDIVYDEIKVSGFEIYIVEQWAADRRLSTLITSYTGNSQDIVSATRVLLPKDTELWPSPLKKYHKELSTFSRPKIINSKNTLFITNLSSVPSTLNLLPIESGDFKKVWDNFKINYDLKRLRCGGRSALLLKTCSRAAGNKFAQLYKIPIRTDSNMENSNDYFHEQNDTNDKQELDDGGNPVDSNEELPSDNYPVVELVTVMQTCLSYFSLFDYLNERNGLLCNHTKRGIIKWWEIYGKFYLGIHRPKNEATMGPTTVASIISLVLSCYFKLMVLGFMSGKDPFDEREFFSGLYSFQKKHGLSKNHKKLFLDEITIEKIFETSAKISNKDIFNFKTVFKSHVQDMTGKGNFMHLSNDILTSDLNTLIKNIYGGKLSIIWKNKDRTKKDLAKLRFKDFTQFNFDRGNPDSVLEHQNEYLRRMKDSELSIVNSNGTRDFLSGNYGSHLSMQGLLNKVGSNPTYVCSNEAFPSDEEKAKKNYEREYFRRNSYPYSKDDLKIPVPIQSDRDVDLYRCNSLSSISDILEPWHLPFDSSVVKIARDILKMENQLKSNNDGNRIILECNSQMDGDNIEPFIKQTKAMNEEFLKTKKNTDLFEEKYKIIENKHLVVAKEKQDIEILVSQLNYNIRILQARFHDVESSIKRIDCELGRINDDISNREKIHPHGIDFDGNSETLSKLLESIVDVERTKYDGLFVKFAQSSYVDEIKSDIKSWFLWAFEGFITVDGEHRDKEE